MIAPMTPSPLDRETATRFIQHLLRTGGPIEIRIIRCDNKGGFITKAGEYPKTLAGFFNNIPSILDQLTNVRGVSVHVVSNPILPELMGREHPNRFNRAGKDELTSKKHISGYWNCLIDVDAVRDSMISATNEERDGAIRLRDEILSDHPEIRASSIWGGSGNGGFILPNLGGMDNDARTEAMVRRFLACLHRKYIHRAAEGKIETSTFDPNRLMPFPGTKKHKGTDLPNRPHRMATLDSPADHVPTVLNLAEWLAIHDAQPMESEPKFLGGATQAGREGVLGGSNDSDAIEGYPLAVVLERATRMVATIPGAVSGEAAGGATHGKHGHGQTFDVACVLIKGFDLPIAQAAELMDIYNQKCTPPWTAEELWHKLTSANEKADDKPRGYLLRESKGGSSSVPMPSPVPQRYKLDDSGDSEKIDIEKLNRIVNKIVKEHDLSTLYRDNDLMRTLAILEHENSTEFQIIKAEFKKIRYFSMKSFSNIFGQFQKRPPRGDSGGGSGKAGGSDGGSGRDSKKIGGDGGKNKSESDKKRPIIECYDVSLDETKQKTIEALENSNDPPEIFNFADTISWVKMSNGEVPEPVVQMMSGDSLKNRMADVATFVQTMESKKGVTVLEIFPPPTVVRSIMAEKQWSEKMAPPLELVVSTPRFVAGGRFLNKTGYDPESKIFYYLDPTMNISAIPDIPSPAEVTEARRFLTEEYLGDFPFDSQASLANAMACMLLPFVRTMFSEATPLHFFEASTEGTGKSKLAHACAFPSLGRELPSTSQKEDEAEWRKGLTTKFMEGSPYLFLDNLNNPTDHSGGTQTIDSGQLAKALTEPIWEDRILGTAKIVKIRIRSVFMATGNNIEWSRELGRRIVPIKLRVMTENPSDRTGFRCSPHTLEEWAKIHRDTLVYSCLILCRHWVASGMPSGNVIFGSYQEYARIMGGILDCAEIPGFMTERNIEYGKNRDLIRWHAFVELWHFYFKTSTVTSSHLRAIFFGGFLDSGIEIPPSDELQIAFNDILGEKSPNSQKMRIGKSLAKQDGRIYGDYRILRNNAKSSTGNATYRLDRVVPGMAQEATQDGGGGVGGEDTDNAPGFDKSAPFQD